MMNSWIQKFNCWLCCYQNSFVFSLCVFSFNLLLKKSIEACHTTDLCRLAHIVQAPYYELPFSGWVRGKCCLMWESQRPSEWWIQLLHNGDVTGRCSVRALYRTQKDHQYTVCRRIMAESTSAHPCIHHEDHIYRHQLHSLSRGQSYSH